jgi:hypothetical protein
VLRNWHGLRTTPELHSKLRICQAEMLKVDGELRKEREAKRRAEAKTRARAPRRRARRR